MNGMAVSPRPLQKVIIHNGDINKLQFLHKLKGAAWGIYTDNLFYFKA